MQRCLIVDLLRDLPKFDGFSSFFWNLKAHFDRKCRGNLGRSLGAFGYWCSVVFSILLRFCSWSFRFDKVWLGVICIVAPIPWEIPVFLAISN